MKCLTCKKHWSQGGRCSENVRNCLHYEEEPRGKMVRTELSFRMDAEAETPVVRFGEKILVSDGSKAVEMTVARSTGLIFGICSAMYPRIIMRMRCRDLRKKRSSKHYMENSCIPVECMG